MYGNWLRISLLYEKKSCSNSESDFDHQPFWRNNSLSFPNIFRYASIHELVWLTTKLDPKYQRNNSWLSSQQNSIVQNKFYECHFLLEILHTNWNRKTNFYFSVILRIFKEVFVQFDLLRALKYRSLNFFESILNNVLDPINK